MQVQKAAVIGAGAMGSGIAQVLSQAGIKVILKDVEQSFVDRGLANIKKNVRLSGQERSHDPGRS